MRPLPTTQRDDGAEQARNDGVRRVRRMSNWTAAVLVVGTGATAVALAHNALPVAGSVSPPAFTGTGATTGTAGSSAGATAGGPHVAHTVATTSASGVTTTTTTRVVNGQTVVTHHTSAPAYHDN